MVLWAVMFYSQKCKSASMLILELINSSLSPSFSLCLSHSLILSLSAPFSNGHLRRIHLGLKGERSRTLRSLMTGGKGYVSGRQMWIFKQIWKKERNYLAWFETLSFFLSFFFFKNKAIICQINEVWSVVITQQNECQQLPFFVDTATFREVLHIYDTFLWLLLLFSVVLKIYIELRIQYTRLY